jgi:hypothetical protein
VTRTALLERAIAAGRIDVEAHLACTPLHRFA